MTVRIINAHVLDGLAQIEDESVHMVCTSPPYFGLRSYGTEPQIWGGDPLCDHLFEHVETIRKGSTNGRADLGSTLVSVGGEKTLAPGLANDQRGTAQYRTDFSAFCLQCDGWRGDLGLEPTPALYIEHLVAVFAEVRRVLRKDGTLWIVIGDSYAAAGVPGLNVSRSSSTFHGGNKDAHLRRAKTVPAGLKPKDLIGIPWRLAFALQDDGWWLRQDNVWHKPNPMPESTEDRTTRSHEFVFHLSKAERYWYDGDAIKEPFETDPKENYPERATILGRGGQLFAEARGSDRDKSGGFPASGGRNKRSVWTVATVPSSVPHFATYPPALIEPCILAGCPVGGTVLDPFIGVGTTAIVAERLARNCIGIELSPKYAAIAERRARSPGFPFEPPEMAAE